MAATPGAGGPATMMTDTGLHWRPCPLGWAGEASTTPSTTQVRICSNISDFRAQCYYFTGYEDDISLLIKLGQAALIIFIILAVISVLFLVTTCCVSMLGVAQQQSKDKQERNTPPPFNMKVW